jgi:hypothetical protein
MEWNLLTGYYEGTWYHFHDVDNNVFISRGMQFPLISVANPTFFVDIYLQIVQTSSKTSWNASSELITREDSDNNDDRIGRAWRN